jgi:(p)ppGpp synthase/HD superfamily hydrolase
LAGESGRDPLAHLVAERAHRIVSAVHIPPRHRQTLPDVKAALLHDAIEDCEVPYSLIADAFGADVADLVAEVTDDKRLPKEERKKLQEDTAHKKSSRAKIPKLADKTSNLRALVSSPAQDWSVAGRSNTSNGLARWSPAAPMRCWRSNLRTPRGPRSNRSCRRYRDPETYRNFF